MIAIHTPGLNNAAGADRDKQFNSLCFKNFQLEPAEDLDNSQQISQRAAAGKVRVAELDVVGADAAQRERRVHRHPAVVDPHFIPHVIGEALLRRIIDQAERHARRNFAGAA